MEKMNLFGDSRQDSKVSLFDYSTDVVYHGSSVVVKKPVIVIGKTTKDFGYGFYITKIKEQAQKWAIRFKKFNKSSIVNSYKFTLDNKLKIKVFEDVTDEWLDFITACRYGKPHTYDVVEGPVADDKIYNYIEDYLAGNINREAFLVLAKFNKPTHQICLCTEQALNCVTFMNYEEVQ